jgi:hypothetical protein
VADEEIAIQTSGVQHQGPTHFPSVAGHRFDVLLRHLEMKDLEKTCKMMGRTHKGTETSLSYHKKIENDFKIC